MAYEDQNTLAPALGMPPAGYQGGPIGGMGAWGQPRGSTPMPPPQQQAAIPDYLGPAPVDEPLPPEPPKDNSRRNMAAILALANLAGVGINAFRKDGGTPVTQGLARGLGMATPGILGAAREDEQRAEDKYESKRNKVEDRNRAVQDRYAGQKFEAGKQAQDQKFRAGENQKELDAQERREKAEADRWQKEYEFRVKKEGNDKALAWYMANTDRMRANDATQGYSPQESAAKAADSLEPSIRQRDKDTRQDAQRKVFAGVKFDENGFATNLPPAAAAEADRLYKAQAEASGVAGQIRYLNSLYKQAGRPVYNPLFEPPEPETALTPAPQSAPPPKPQAPPAAPATPKKGIAGIPGMGGPSPEQSAKTKQQNSNRAELDRRAREAESQYVAMNGKAPKGFGPDYQEWRSGLDAAIAAAGGRQGAPQAGGALDAAMSDPAIKARVEKARGSRWTDAQIEAQLRSEGVIR